MLLSAIGRSDYFAPVDIPNDAEPCSGGSIVKTIYDLVTVALFAGLAILYLMRSAGPQTPKDRIYHYLPPAAGCALANWLGNEHQDILAIGLIAAVVVYSMLVLKPFAR
jgi:hypothetical protein